MQGVSLLFFLIHAGIAIANLGPSDPTEPNDAWIAGLNALSGILFLIAAIYGNRAYRDMDPVAALRSGRALDFRASRRRPGSLRGPGKPAPLRPHNRAARLLDWR